MPGSGPRNGGALRDGLIAAAHREILRLKEVNERLLQAQTESESLLAIDDKVCLLVWQQNPCGPRKLVQAGDISFFG